MAEATEAARRAELAQSTPLLQSTRRELAATTPLLQSSSAAPTLGAANPTVFLDASAAAARTAQVLQHQTAVSEPDADAISNAGDEDFTY